MSRILTRTGKHGSIYTKEVSKGRLPLNGCMCQDGSCESCNQLVGAFEAMREALLVFVNSHEPRKQAVTDRAHAALALADKVKP